MNIAYILYIYSKKGDGMEIFISNTSDKPLYEQITAQIKNLILSGALKEGDALPSMRILAKELRISVITTKRAYEELEREGFIVTQSGKGSYVAARNVELIREENYRRIEQQLLTAVNLARLSEISLDEMIEILTLLYKEE